MGMGEQQAGAGPNGCPRSIEGLPRGSGGGHGRELSESGIRRPLHAGAACRQDSQRGEPVTNHDLDSDGPLTATLGARPYVLRLQARDPDRTDATVVLSHEDRTQVLYSAGGFVDDPHFRIVWAGDLDRDGKLDLIVNLHRKYSVHPYRLLLSTKARGTGLVGEAAVFETGD